MHKAPSDDQEPTLQTVRRVHDRLVPSLQRLFAKSLKRNVDVSVVDASPVQLGQYVQSLGACCCNYHFTINQRKEGNLAFSLPLCAALLDPEKDGKEVQRWVDEIPAPPLKLRESDFGILAQPVKVVAEKVEKAWEIRPELGLENIENETDPSLIDMEDPTDPAVHVKFELGSKGYEDLTMSLCYSNSLIEHILQQLRSR